MSELRLSDCEKIINIELFLSTSEAIILNPNVNKKVKQPYIERYNKLLTLLNQNKGRNNKAHNE